MTSATLSDIQQRMIETAERPLDQAIALPAKAYTDPAYYDWEVEHILKKQWLCVGHQSQIPNPGDYFHFDLFEEPLIITRDKTEQIHVLSRVCAHRGMDLMPVASGHESSGHRHRLLCPYHHWSYALDGTLVAAPEMHKNQIFEASKLCLPRFRSEIWEGFIFVTFDAEISEVRSQFAPLLPFVGQRQMADLEMVAALTWECPFNWKVLVENFMESYHHLGAHYRTFESIMPAAGTWTESDTGDTIISHLPFSPKILEHQVEYQALIEFPPVPTLHPQDHCEYAVYLGAPTFLLFGGPDRVYWYGLQPHSPNQMTLTTTMLIHPDSKDAENYEQSLGNSIESLKRFHLEDMEMCSAVQSGLTASSYQPGPLSHLEMPVWLFQRYLSRQIQRAIQTAHDSSS